MICARTKQAYLFAKHDRLPKKAIGSTMLAAHSNRSNYLILYIIKNVY